MFPLPPLAHPHTPKRSQNRTLTHPPPTPSLTQPSCTGRMVWPGCMIEVSACSNGEELGSRDERKSGGGGFKALQNDPRVSCNFCPQRIGRKIPSLTLLQRTGCHQNPSAPESRPPPVVLSTGSLVSPSIPFGAFPLVWPFKGFGQGCSYPTPSFWGRGRGRWLLSSSLFLLAESAAGNRIWG